ncbi:MAG: OmpA family protein [Sneathiella sp.]|nr:OmpA family protein [Sneathiella sp.]
MAISRRTATGKNKIKTGLSGAAMAACMFAASPSVAQTVIIGGGNDRPVIVNYPPAYTPSYPQGNLSQGQAMAPSSHTGVDYSKSATIQAGDEVIILTPPSEQKKKPAKAVRAPKKKPAPVETTAKERQEEPQKIVKAETPKAPAPITPKPEEKAQGAKPAPVKKQPAPKSVEKVGKTPEPKPTVTAETPKADEPTAPEAIKAEEKAPAPVEKVEEKAEEKIADKAPQPAAPKPIAPVVKEQPPEEKEQDVAALDPKSDISAQTAKIPEVKPEVDKASQTLMFEKDETNLPNNSGPVLAAISKQVEGGQDRVQIEAYADASSNGRARRISLGRALSIRTKLMELGVPNNRIEVRALGLPTDNSPADRVELKIVTR